MARPVLMSRSAVLAVFAALVGCQPNAPPIEVQAPGSGNASSKIAPAPSSSASAPATPGDATASIRITNLGPGRFEIAPSGTSAARVATAAAIERKAPDGSWVALANLDIGRGYRIIDQCEPDPPACREIAPGNAARPVPFKGLGCSAQCNFTCRSNGWEGPGTFRLALKTCDGAAVAGPPFELPSSDFANGAAFARWSIAEGAARATIMRLDFPGKPWEFSQPAKEGELAGFAIRKGTERPLDAAALASLGKLLRDPAGFDDLIAKRCAMKNLVGVRLVRSLASTGDPAGAAPREETVEIAVDFSCHKLFAVTPDAPGKPRLVHATHFDPSHAAFAAFVKGGLPGDPEIVAVR